MNPSKKSDSAIEMDSSSRSEWQEPPSLTLDEYGIICDCSKAGEKHFGYSRMELICQPVSKLLPELSEIQLVKSGQFNPKIGFLSRCGRSFQVKNRLGEIFMNNLHFVLLGYAGAYTIRVILHP